MVYFVQKIEMLCFLSIFNARELFLFSSEANLGANLLASPTSPSTVYRFNHLGSLESGKFSFVAETLHRWLSRRWRLLFVRGKFLTLTLVKKGGTDAPWKNDKSIFDILFYYQSSLVKIIFPPLCLTFHHDPLSFA